MAVDAISSQKTLQEIINKSSENAKENTSELGKDQFMELLVTQLRYQDPLNPVDDKEFIGQMAQFTSLEQMQNLNQNFEASKAFSLIGKEVMASVKDDTSDDFKEIQGIVESVKIKDSKSIVVINGTEVEVGSITDVYDIEPIKESSIQDYTDIIGNNVTAELVNAKTDEKVNIFGLVTSVEKSNNGSLAALEDVRIEVSDVLTNIKSTAADFKTKYLDSKIGSEVTLEVIDSESGNKTEITGILDTYAVSSSGRIAARLDKVMVSVDSINSIENSLVSEM